MTEHKVSPGPLTSGTQHSVGDNGGRPIVAALYVEKDGVYAGLPDVDIWDEKRDARQYAGPWPVVAHPPCQRWCRFAKGIEKVHGYKVGDDDGCFKAALDAVWTWGGVIEHPAGSLAWDEFGLPKPMMDGGWTGHLWDMRNGASCYVEQGRYGHPMRKATWLYAVGIEFPALRWGRVNDHARLGKYKWGHRADRPEHDRNRPRIDRLHSVTPVEFRDELLAMARSVRSAPDDRVTEEEIAGENAGNEQDWFGGEAA